ncbi:MAG: tetratricopeptide repeat protein [Saprospiraceae bacterium]|nr:tetratricopeptide repeat protein [Saprospiraceae bacterium]
MALDGKGWRYGKLLAQEYLAQGHLQEALMIATKYHQDYPANDGVAFLLAKCMIENKKYEAAYTLLMSKTFLPMKDPQKGGICIAKRRCSKRYRLCTKMILQRHCSLSVKQPNGRKILG